MQDEKAIKRFMAKVAQSENCWVWTASINKAGYGQFSHQRKPRLAYKWIYEQLNGPVPDGMQLDHLCRNRACVNPKHLEVVTRLENVRRGDAGKHMLVKSKAITHCPRGHQYTPENTYWAKKGRARACVECRKIWSKARAAKEKAARQAKREI